RAVDHVKTLALDRQEFMDFLMSHPHASIDVLTVISRRLYRSDMLLRQSVSKNVNELAEGQKTFGQRLSDGFASLMGSWRFIIWQSALLSVWVAYNGVATYHNAKHPESK